MQLILYKKNNEKGIYNCFYTLQGCHYEPGGQGFPPASISVATGYFYWKIEEN